MYALRITGCVVASALAHAALFGGLDQMPPAPPRPEAVTIQVVAPPPPPPPPPVPPPQPKVPEPEPQVAKPEPKVVHEVPNLDRPKPTRQPPPTQVPVETKNTTPSERAPTAGAEATDVPVMGISLESTSQAGAGPAAPVGNTLQTPQAGPAQDPKKSKPLSVPAPIHEVEKMPVMRDRCTGKYTDAARDAGVEGTVVLDLIVDEDGTTRDIKVVQGLGYGLDEAAIAALKHCRFTAGTKNGQPVAVRVRAFKVRFFPSEEP